MTFGYVSDAIGRKRTYVAYLLLAAVLVLGLHVHRRIPWVLLALGPVTSFFATGHFSGFGVVTAELYPTAVRATAQGFTYNLGRIASARRAAVAGSVAQITRLSRPRSQSPRAAYVLASLFWFVIPETKGRKTSI